MFCYSRLVSLDSIEEDNKEEARAGRKRNFYVRRDLFNSVERDAHLSIDCKTK